MNRGLIISAIFLIVISCPLMMGKWSNLIAGYNTMSETEKEKYDKLKLCRYAGITLFITGLVLILGANNIISFNDTVIIGITVIIIGMIIADFCSKKK